MQSIRHPKVSSGPVVVVIQDRGQLIVKWKTCVGFSLPFYSLVPDCNSLRSPPSQINDLHTSLCLAFFFWEPSLRSWRSQPLPTQDTEQGIREYLQNPSSGISYHVANLFQVSEPLSPHSWNGFDKTTLSIPFSNSPLRKQGVWKSLTLAKVL
jgi:hypothetical protein